MEETGVAENEELKVGGTCATSLHEVLPQARLTILRAGYNAMTFGSKTVPRAKAGNDGALLLSLCRHRNVHGCFRD